MDTGQTEAIYGVLLAIQRDLGALQGGVAQLDKRTEEIHVEVKRTNGRVTSLESDKSKVVGMALGVTAVVAAIWEGLKALMGK